MGLECVAARRKFRRYRRLRRPLPGISPGSSGGYFPHYVSGCIGLPQGVYRRPAWVAWRFHLFFAAPANRRGYAGELGDLPPPFPHGILGQMAWRLAAFPPGRPHRGAPILCPSRKSGNPVNRERAEKRRKSLLSFIIWAGQQVAQCAAISPPLGANASASLPAQLSY